MTEIMISGMKFDVYQSPVDMTGLDLANLEDSFYKKINFNIEVPEVNITDNGQLVGQIESIKKTFMPLITGHGAIELAASIIHKKGMSYESRVKFLENSKEWGKVSNELISFFLKSFCPYLLNNMINRLTEQATV